MNKKRFYTLFRYVLSYLLVSIIPLSIFMPLSYRFFVKEYRREVDNNRAHSLNIVNSSVELIFSQMDNIVRQLQFEENLYYDIKRDFSSAIKFKNRLYKYTNTTVFLRDTMVYLRGSDYICAASSTYSVDTYADNVNTMQGISPEVFRKYLMNVDTRIILPVTCERQLVSSQSDVIIAMYPLPYPEIHSYATVVFKIEPNAIRKLLSGGNSAVIFETPGEDLIVSGNPQQEKELRQIMEAASFDIPEDSFLCTLNGEKYMITYTRNSKLGIMYVNMVPYREAMHKISQVQNIFVLLILMLGALEMIVLFAVAYRNYLPIQSLHEFMKRNYSLPEQKREFRLKTVENVFTDVMADYKRIQTELNVNRDALWETVLYKMVNGGFRTREEFLDVCSQAGIEITGPYLRIAVASAENQDPTFSESMIQELRERLKTNQVYGFRQADLQVLVIADNAECRDKYHTQLQAFLSSCMDRSGREIWIGVSDICTDISKLYLSYIKASSALGYSLSTGVNHLVFYNDILPEMVSFNDYPGLELESIYTAITDQDGEHLAVVIREILQSLENHKYDLPFVKLVTYDLVNTMIKAAIASGRNEYQFTASFPDMVSLSATRTYQELKDMICGISENVISYLGKKDVTIDHLMEQVIRVIEENAFRYDFSIKMLSSRFGMSQNNLSQQFKRYTGQTPTEYLNTLRMNKTKYYLLKTDLTLKQIAEHIGYANESSFIRKFRDEEGMTPGEYRRKFKT